MSSELGYGEASIIGSYLKKREGGGGRYPWCTRTRSGARMMHMRLRQYVMYCSEANANATEITKTRMQAMLKPHKRGIIPNGCSRLNRDTRPAYIGVCVLTAGDRPDASLAPFNCPLIPFRLNYCRKGPPRADIMMIWTVARWSESPRISPPSNDIQKMEWLSRRSMDDAYVSVT